jgi:hydroxypyruvate isomerase
MGEHVPDVLSGEVQHVFHVHVADHPGRHEPGTGDLALREGLNWIFAHGYQGMVGLEYKPSFTTSYRLPSALEALA